MSHGVATAGFALQQADDLSVLDFAGSRFVEQQDELVGADGAERQQQVPDIRLAREHRQTWLAPSLPCRETAGAAIPEIPSDEIKNQTANIQRIARQP